jgi:post-segregation antitoxin (ccd killing protein)
MAKTSITIPDDLYQEARELTDNFSSFVSEAVREHVRKVRTRKARESFGKWEEREKESTALVDELRVEDRDDADRSD